MAYIYDIADTWNASGTVFTAIKMSVTDTASAAGSLLMDLQVGGMSQFKVTKAGRVEVPDGGWFGGVDADSGFQFVGTGRTVDFLRDNSVIARFGVTVSFASNISLGTNGTSGDVFLARDAANTLAQRHGVNAQAFNLYNTYTDASNYERGFMRFVSNTLRIGTEKLGTGTARALELHTDGVARLTLATTGEASFAGRISAVSNSLSYSAPTYGFGSCGISATVSNPIIYFHAPSYGFLALAQTSVAINGSMSLGFYAADPSNTSVDAAFARDAADTIAQRRGTNAQTSRLYGTYTDASNYRRLTKTMSTAGVAEIKPEGAGTGASGNVLHISGLPTSNPGPGILWNNAGTPAIGT